jgi:hypothetical protein
MGDASVSRNIVTASGDDGIHVDVPANTLTGNRTDRNLDFGIEAVLGTIDGRHNRANATLTNGLLGSLDDFSKLALSARRSISCPRNTDR